MTKVTFKIGFLIKRISERLVLVVTKEILTKKLNNEIYIVFVITSSIVRV